MAVLRYEMANNKTSLEGINKDIRDSKKELDDLRSDYDKLVSKGIGVTGAVMFIGTLLGWMINTLRGGH